MADYYPLLLRSLENVANPRPETRQKVYEKARAALISQLRNIQPPLSEAEMLHECMALDEAVLAVEQAYAQSGRHSDDVYVGQSGRDHFQAEQMMDSQYHPHDAQAYHFQPEPNNQTVHSEYPREERAGGIAQYSSQEFGYQQPADFQDNGGSRPVQESYSSQYHPYQQTSEVYPYYNEQADHPESYGNGEGFLNPEENQQADVSVRDLRPRLVVPESEEDSINKKRRLIVLVAVFSLVFVVAGLALALKLRDDHIPVSGMQTEKNGSTTASKENAGDIPDSQPLPPKSGERVGAAPVTEFSEVVQENTNVEQRAFLVEQTALQPPNHQKRTVGGIVWSLENKDGPQGKDVSVIHGRVSFPAENLNLDLKINKNTDPSLSASHTILFSFSSLSANSPKKIKTFHPEMFMMANLDTPAVKLSGGVVELEANNFVYAVQNTPENQEIFKKLSWLRIFLIYDSNQTAVIDFEKGPEGQRIFDEALRNWEQ